MSAESDLEFLRQIQRLLEEGGFVATYKFALLQSLADLSVESNAGPISTLTVGLDEIAERFIEYYWPQAAPFRAPGGEHEVGVLKQNLVGQAAVVKNVMRAREECGSSIQEARRRQNDWRKLVRRVAGTVENMPLWRLQTVGGETREFLYRRADYHDRKLLLLPGVAHAFRGFYSLITNLVRGGWLAQIRRIGRNQAILGESGDLSEFLFGSERRGLAPYRRILKEHQRGKCFYCEKSVSGEGEADHFVPWSRYPVDLGHNFVFAHKSCNNQKRDFLAHPEHLSHWKESNLESGGMLGDMFDEEGLLHDLNRTAMITRWAYEQGERVGAHVWLTGRRIEPLRGDWRTAMEPVLRVAEPMSDRG